MWDKRSYHEVFWTTSLRGNFTSAQNVQSKATGTVKALTGVTQDEYLNNQKCLATMKVGGGKEERKKGSLFKCLKKFSENHEYMI